MEEQNKAEVEVQISITDANDEALDRATRQLLSELREERVESASLKRANSAPEGSKGDPISIGSILIEALPVALPGIIALIQGWIIRGQGRNVKIRSKGIDFEGTPEEFQKFLVILDKRERKK